MVEVPHVEGCNNTRLNALVMFMTRSNAMYTIQHLLHRHVQEKFESLSWKFVEGSIDNVKIIEILKLFEAR